MRRHTSQEYEAELGLLRERILLMGAKVEHLTRASVHALMERDERQARSLMIQDREINNLELEIDELCLQILARRQPVASDLRFITTALKLVKDMERIGDLAVNVAERVVELSEATPVAPPADLPHMADVAIGMVHDALDAFVAENDTQAEDVITQDENVDRLYTNIIHEMLEQMSEDSSTIFRASRMQSVAKYLERIADHATNLAEMVIFYVRGTDVRHPKSQGRQWPRP